MGRYSAFSVGYRPEMNFSNAMQIAGQFGDKKVEAAEVCAFICHQNKEDPAPTLRYRTSCVLRSHQTFRFFNQSLEDGEDLSCYCPVDCAVIHRDGNVHQRADFELAIARDCALLTGPDGEDH